MLVLFLQKQETSGEILQAMNALKEGGVTQKWGAALQEPFQRRNVFMGELKRVGVLNPQAIGIASISECSYCIAGSPSSAMRLGFAYCY